MSGSASAADALITAVDTEIIGEMASSLGNAGRKVEAAMVRLNTHRGTADERAVLVRQAAGAVYAYFVQRELCGLRRHDDAIRDYAIPREVLVRLGAR